MRDNDGVRARARGRRIEMFRYGSRGEGYLGISVVFGDPHKSVPLAQI